MWNQLEWKPHLPDTPPATYAAIISPTEKPMWTVRGSPRLFRLRTVWATEPQPNNWQTRGEERSRFSPTSQRHGLISQSSLEVDTRSQTSKNKYTVTLHQDTFVIQNVTYNQDKRPQEFCQEFLEYSMFDRTVLPHASLVLYFHVSPCQVLLKLPNVHQCEPPEFSNLHLSQSAATHNRPLIQRWNHHGPLISPNGTQRSTRVDSCYTSISPYLCVCHRRTNRQLLVSWDVSTSFYLFISLRFTIEGKRMLQMNSLLTNEWIWVEVNKPSAAL